MSCPNDKRFTHCNDEKQLLARLFADINRLDPDLIVCHDSSLALSTILQRINRIKQKNDRIKMGRLIFAHYDSGKDN